MNFNRPPAEFTRDEALAFLRSSASRAWCEAIAVLIADDLDEALNDPDRSEPSIGEGMRWSVEMPASGADDVEHEAWLDRKPGGRPAWAKTPDKIDYPSGGER